MATVKSAKKGPRTVPQQSPREFVLGSRPPDVYSPRIKPLEGQTQYGKQTMGPRQPSFNLGTGTTNGPGF